jgi:hypothetical protein
MVNSSSEMTIDEKLRQMRITPLPSAEDALKADALYREYTAATLSQDPGRTSKAITEINSLWDKTCGPHLEKDASASSNSGHE